MIRSVFFISLLVLLGCNTKNSPIKQDAFVRNIQLDGQDNFRDIGNYTTIDGRRVKQKVIYRSGTLSKLSGKDKQVIQQLGIRTVVNFLTEEEINARGADNLPEGVKSFYFPISGDNGEASVVLKARQTGDFTEVPIELNYNIHKLLPEIGKDAYVNFFKVLADSINYPLVFHCSHGVHRTGTATALLHSLLGVSWDAIEKDYLLSNECRMHESQVRIHQLDSLARTSFETLNFDRNRKNIEAFYMLQPQYIAGTKEYIHEYYSSFIHYFKEIGLTDAEIKTIKNNLLE